MNDVRLRDSITPHYVNLGLLQFRDIVKYYTCLLCMYISVIISLVIFQYLSYLSNVIIIHEVHLPKNYLFPILELI